MRGVLIALAAIVLVAAILHGVVLDPHLQDPRWVAHFYAHTEVLKDVWYAGMGFVGALVLSGLAGLWARFVAGRPPGYYAVEEDREATDE